VAQCLRPVLPAELGPVGITVNCVAPGFVPTKFSAALVADKELVSAVVASNQFVAVGHVYRHACIGHVYRGLSCGTIRATCVASLGWGWKVLLLTAWHLASCPPSFLLLWWQIRSW
jgi:NAD(P)-dependent dehydrogenase (short-subunit alcohol dehydrogenase family)